VKRREFITLLGGAATSWPLLAGAQQMLAMPVVGFLAGNQSDLPLSLQIARAFRQGLSETGYVEGRNVMIDYRWANEHLDRLPALAVDLVRRPVTLIAALGDAAARAAKASTATIPIVFATGTDPIEMGLVAGLNRPGANATGVSMLNAALAAKRLELVHEFVPKATRIALLVNPTSRNAEIVARELKAAAATLGLELHVVDASTEDGLAAVFPRLVRLGAGALVVATDGFFNGHSEQIASLAIRHGVPAIYQYHDFAAAGGLMSYGGNFVDAVRQVGVYAGRILMGEKPADLPVQQSTKIELFINLKTAKTLGLNVPLPLLGRAEEVIE
jgi:putative ABC transport system substrate-binding protein